MANEFKPALPKQGKWSVGENRFDEEGQNPKSLSIFIPEDSIDGFCRYVQNLRSKAKPGKSLQLRDQVQRRGPRHLPELQRQVG